MKDTVNQTMHIPGHNPDETPSINLCHNQVTNPQTQYKLDLYLLMMTILNQKKTSTPVSSFLWDMNNPGNLGSTFVGLVSGHKCA